MSYQEWKRRIYRDIDTPGFGGAFWEIIDFNWKPEEQSALARVWKEKT